MYLSILLIVIALIVFYNEVNSKMNVAEYALLFISIIAIIRASINYINIDVVTEGFTSSNNNNSQRIAWIRFRDEFLLFAQHLPSSQQKSFLDRLKLVA